MLENKNISKNERHLRFEMIPFDIKLKRHISLKYIFFSCDEKQRSNLFNYLNYINVWKFGKKKQTSLGPYDHKLGCFFFPSN